mmetsp:Transcript_19495/g.74816  ORF Transcript_19495/g.74816 Transcript_19495/m.74816 type:complete len:687 (-) Transcript_19495:83-2143(-)
MPNTEINVRLPGAKTPEVVLVNSDLTAKEGVQVISQRLAVEKLSDARLVIAPTNKKNGAIVCETSVIKNIMFSPKEDVLELWKAPAMLNVAIYFREGGTDNLRDKKMIPIDLESALVHMIPTIQRALDFPPEQEFSFQFGVINEAGRVEKARWITTQLSLDEQECSADGCLLVYPLAKLMKSSEQSIVAVERGMLFKRSMKKDRTTSKQRRLFLLSGPFLFYYKKERDATPCGVIPLEYYVIRKKLNKKRKFSMMLTLACDAFKNMTGSYKLQADTLESMESWFDKIKRKCVNSGNKKVFGVDMKEVVARKSNQNRFMPRLVLACIQFLEAQAMELEGLFRISASASIVEYYKDQYDCGEEVTFDNIYDFHIPANLLKLYLREMPEPLFTFDLYDRFVACGLTPDTNELAAIMADLPVENYATSKLLFSFLHEVSTRSEVNKMGASNLATVFGPNLVRNRSDTPNVQDFGVINTIIQSIIARQEAVFEAAEQINTKLQAIKIRDSGARASVALEKPKPGVGMGRGRGAPMMGALVQQMRDRQRQPPAKEGTTASATPATKGSPGPAHKPMAPRGRGRGRGGPGGKAAPPVAPRRDLDKRSGRGGTLSNSGGSSTPPPAAAPPAAVAPPSSPAPAPAAAAAPALEPSGMTIEDLLSILEVERRARDALESQVQELMSRVAALEERSS